MSPAGDALAGLRDIQLPDPVALWPLAPGWWALAALLTAGALLLVWLVRARRAAPEREANRILDALVDEYRRQRDAVALSTGLSQLLRRLALARRERAEVAGLHGVARARALAGGAPDAATEGFVERLEDFVYRAGDRALEPGELDAWVARTRRFIGSRS